MKDLLSKPFLKLATSKIFKLNMFKFSVSALTALTLLLKGSKKEEQVVLSRRNTNDVIC